MNHFQLRLKFGEEAENLFEEVLKLQILPNKGYERFTFQSLRDKHGWNSVECQKFTKVNGDFKVIGQDDEELFFDVKGTEKLSLDSLEFAREDLIFAMNFHLRREHCFFFRKSDVANKIKNVCKKVKLPSGDDGFSIWAAQDFPQERLYTELPRKILSLKKKLRKKAAEEFSDKFFGNVLIPEI